MLQKSDVNLLSNYLEIIEKKNSKNIISKKIGL